MKDPKRLCEERSDRLTVLLLEAGRDEAPSKEWLGRTLGGAVAAGTTLAATAAAAGTAAPLASSALPIALVVKWLGIGALVGVVASAGTAAVLPDQRESSSEVAAPREQSPAVAVIAPAAPKPPAALVPLNPPARTAAPVPVAALPAPPRSALVRSPVAPETRAVREEVRALGRAKAALNHGRPADTLAILAEYRARFPQGHLRPEAVYLEMEAELARGNRERARVLAHALSVGRSPNAERARAILKEEQR